MKTLDTNVFMLDNLQNTEAEYESRWDSIRREGRLERIDEGLTAMIQLSLAAASAKGAAREEALDDLEAAAFATSIEIRGVLAPDLHRCTRLPKNIGIILVKAVGQYLPNIKQEVRGAMLDGAQQAVDCRIGLVSIDSLAVAEKGYVTWAQGKLIQRMILTAG